LPRARDFLKGVEHDARIVLAIATQRAAQRIEQKALGLMDRFLRKQIKP
jgi:hypothetical protein